MTNVELIKKTFDNFEKDPKQLGIQSVFTPVDALANFFNFKKEVEGKKNIGILFNVEFLEYFIREINDIENKEITYYYDSPIDYCIAWNIVNKYENVELISIEDITSKNIETLKEKIMPKHFDVLFTNPPYNDDMDCTLIDMCVKEKLAKTIIAVHPTKFIFNKKGNVKAYNILKEDIKHCVSLHTFWGNDMFDILLAFPLCISIWDTTKKYDYVTINDPTLTNSTFTINNFDNITLYGVINDIMLEKINKVMKNKKKYDTFSTTDKRKKFKNLNPEKWAVTISIARGTFPTDEKGMNADFYSWMNKDKVNYSSVKDWDKNNLSKRGFCYEFNTEEECKNCEGVLKSIIYRWFNSFVKSGRDITQSELDTIPFIDFSHSWTEDELCEEFGIDDELKKFIYTNVPKYYEKDFKENN